MIYYLPMLLALVSNILYNITAKNTPHQVNPFASLFLVYIIATICSYGFYLLTSNNSNLLTELPKMNWTTVVMGFTIVGIEAGYLYMFRSGWAISSASVTVNILLAIALLFVGMLFYKEHINFYKLAGLILCIVGLFLINKK